MGLSVCRKEEDADSDPQTREDGKVASANQEEDQQDCVASSGTLEVQNPRDSGCFQGVFAPSPALFIQSELKQDLCFGFSIRSHQSRGMGIRQISI